MTSPGLPLVNQRGINPEPDMGAFQVETPHASVAAVDSPPVMIDYVHPGSYKQYCFCVHPSKCSCNVCP